MSVGVLLVDDHALFRQGVRTILETSPDLSVVGEAANGKQAVELYPELRPDVVLMDIRMPVMSGLEAIRQLRALDPKAKILILTVSEEDEDLFEAIRAGANGYLLKNVDPDELISSIRKVARGEAVIPGLLAARIMAEFHKESSQDNAVEPLTGRELEVLGYLSTGASNREIAKQLFISEHTVRNHIQNILGKLHLTNRVQAAAYAIRQGIRPPEDGHSPSGENSRGATR
ncbi:MAG: response regulator transcription factor [Alicyclobacillaceae bacterium]|nr:response regulator transcription factor [Alicyclobacillaceae bacterium]